MPDPARTTLIRSVFHRSPLEEAAEAVSVATETERQVYVERFGDQWRWSLVHAGGPYPLLRITARFLAVDYTTIFSGCREIDGGLSVLTEDPGKVEEPDAWAVLTFRGKVTAEAAAERMVTTLPLRDGP